MKNIWNITAVFATMALFFVGCGGGEGLVPVSGKVTANGQPLAGVRVVFNPLATSENLNPGTWSTGLTNQQGEFTLVNKNKKDGAVVGNHAVSFEYDDMDPDEMDELRDDLDEAKGEDGSRDEVVAVQKQMDEIKRLIKTRPQFSENFELNFTVPDGGTKDANFAVSATKNN